MARFHPPGQCPACGEWVPKGRAACDDCGACEKSGWRDPDDARSRDGLDLPDEDDFDYEDFVAREFGQGSRRSASISGNRHSLWFWAGLILFIIFLLGFLMPLFTGK